MVQSRGVCASNTSPSKTGGQSNASVDSFGTAIHRRSSPCSAMEDPSAVLHAIKPFCLCCADARAAAAQEIIAANGLRSVVGKLVKVKFISVDNDAEHMHVRVLIALPNGTLVGILLNDPIGEYIPLLAAFDRVFFNLDNISGIVD